MSDQNPLGIIEFDHIHFTVKDTTAIDASYDAMGFTKSATTQEKGVTSHLYSQGAIRVVISGNPPADTFPGEYLRKHGEGVCTMAFHVQNAEHEPTGAQTSD